MHSTRTRQKLYHLLWPRLSHIALLPPKSQACPDSRRWNIDPISQKEECQRIIIGTTCEERGWHGRLWKIQYATWLFGLVPQHGLICSYVNFKKDLYCFAIVRLRFCLCSSWDISSAFKKCSNHISACHKINGNWPPCNQGDFRTITSKNVTDNLKHKILST